MTTTSSARRWTLVTAAVTGLTAASGYLGVVGLIGGGLSFGPAIDARLPFGSLPLAGVALLLIVAVPQTIATVAAGRDSPMASLVVFGAGLLLVAWIGIELAFIKVYSWFHPTYLAVAVVILLLGWILERGRVGRRPADLVTDRSLPAAR